MTAIRSSQLHIFAFDSETRVTTAEYPDFALSLRGNISTIPLMTETRKSSYFKPFPRYRPHFLDSRTTVSRVIFLCQHRPDDQIEVELTDQDFVLTAAEAAATYEELKAFVKVRYGFKVTSLYISQVKRKCGLPVGECYYHPKNPNPVIPQCPPEKEAAIRAALEYFQMLSPGGFSINL